MFRSLRKGGNANQQKKAKICSVLHPGNQLYHSLLCTVLQFLILRLMGRTITAVISTFLFQMVNVFPLAAQVTADSNWGWVEGGDCVEKTNEVRDLISNPLSQEHSSVTLGRSPYRGPRCFICKWQWSYFTCLREGVPANPLHRTVH